MYPARSCGRETGIALERAFHTRSFRVHPARVCKVARHLCGTTMGSSSLRFRTGKQFRFRIVCAILSGRKIRIDDIQATRERVGLDAHHSCFLDLVTRVTNGTIVNINTTGTGVYVGPGTLMGGMHVVDCPSSRPLAYYIEPLMMLAPFCKSPLHVTLRGVTNGRPDATVDLLRTCAVPVARAFGVDGMVVKIVKRGAPPNGQGEVVFESPVVRSLRPVRMVEPGKVRKIRGIAYGTRVGVRQCHRMRITAEELFGAVTDTSVYVDHAATVPGADKKKRGADGTAQREPSGYGLALVAETDTGCLYCSDAVAGVQGGQEPEVVARTAASALCKEIQVGGCVSALQQVMVLLFMVCCPPDVSTVRIGQLTNEAIDAMRALYIFFDRRKFRIRECVVPSLQQQRRARGFGKGGGDTSGGRVTSDDAVNEHMVDVSVVGVGVSNMSKKIT